MSIRDQLDISKYFVVGPENTKGRPVSQMIRAVVNAGFTCIQLRSKEAGAREMMDLANQSAEIIAAAGASDKIALLVDDRLDVVLAARKQGIKVDGIHVGQSDIPVEVCREYLGLLLSFPSYDISLEKKAETYVGQGKGGKWSRSIEIDAFHPEQFLRRITLLEGLGEMYGD